jgi:uncharacterized protein (TIGR03435 family)
MRLVSAYVFAALVLATASTAHAQTVDAARRSCQPGTLAAAFEVASVRRVPANREGFTKFSPPNTDRYAVENMSLSLLVSVAYGVNSSRIESHLAWLDSTYYDVTAKSERPATGEELQPMLQKLLQERFHLACHFEARQVSGYAMVLAPGGAKLQPHGTAAASGSILPGGLHASSISVKTLAAMLERPAGKPIDDQTGLAGKYDVHLAFAPDDVPDSTQPSLFTALQEQLGLKLVPQKVMIQVLVIDRADQDPTEN